jgi:hypothetical protein
MRIDHPNYLADPHIMRIKMLRGIPVIALVSGMAFVISGRPMTNLLGALAMVLCAAAARSVILTVTSVFLVLAICEPLSPVVLPLGLQVGLLMLMVLLSATDFHQTRRASCVAGLLSQGLWLVIVIGHPVT